MMFLVTSFSGSDFHCNVVLRRRDWTTVFAGICTIGIVSQVEIYKDLLLSIVFQI
jgi:hypothetical protein